MTGEEQLDAMIQAIDTLSRCRFRIGYNCTDRLWPDHPYDVDIDKSISGLMGLIDNLEEPDL